MAVLPAGNCGEEKPINWLVSDEQSEADVSLVGLWTLPSKVRKVKMRCVSQFQLGPWVSGNSHWFRNAAQHCKKTTDQGSPGCACNLIGCGFVKIGLLDFEVTGATEISSPERSATGPIAYIVTAHGSVEANSNPGPNPSPVGTLNTLLTLTLTQILDTGPNPGPNPGPNQRSKKCSNPGPNPRRMNLD